MNFIEIELTDEQLENVSGAFTQHESLLEQEQREREEREAQERQRQHHHGHWAWLHGHRQWFWDR